MNLRRQAVLRAAVLWAACAAVAGAGQIEICNVQPNIDYACVGCDPTARELPIAVFEFKNEPGYGSIQSLAGLEFTMAMQTASPTSGLRLALNGIDTGISLDGFARDTLGSKTFSLSEADAGWLTPEKESALLASLRENDGEVTASLLADAPENLRIQLYSDTDVKLCLTAETPETVPEPGALLLWTLAAAAAVARRRFAG